MSRNIVALLVYDRLHNLKRWLHCWKQCEKHEFELVVIHNTDSDQPEYRESCEQYGVKYVPRPNIGFDTAPFQDICRERLQGFDNDWDKLIWVTDDWIPMAKNFVKQYKDHFEDGVTGIVCTEISDLVKRHIRTSGFMISKEISKNIIFDADPITNKDQCYDFEHRSVNALYEQIQRMGLEIRLVAPLNIAPIWDTDHRSSLQRWNEHTNVFYSTQKVAIICPIYKCFPQIISSMINQTHQYWELYLIHDGEADPFIGEYVKLVNDERIKYIVTENRVSNFGHPIRQEYLKKLASSDADYILITNGDNYHTPNCLETLVKGFDENCVATYGDGMVHSYFGWGVINCRMERGYIDCACVMVKKEIACSIGWNDTVSHSSDWTYFEDIAKVYGFDKFKQVHGCLLIHN